MAQLSHLRPSISEVSSESALALIKTIRANRRAVREQRAAAFALKEEARKTRATAKKQPKSSIASLSLDTMSADTLEAIIGMLSNMLEPGDTDGEDSMQDEGTSASLN